MKQEYINMVNELIEDAKKLNKFNMPSREFKEFENAIEDACERQLPVEAISGWEFVCPNCENYHMDDSYEYCNECGQKITWGDES